MAVTLGEAILYLRSQDDGLTSGLDRAEKKTTSWARGLGGKIGPLIGGAVVAGTAAAGAAIVGIGAKAFSVSEEVQSAANAMQGSFGLTADEAQRLADVGVDVFGNNFAGSITEAAEAVALVRQQLGDLGDENLQDATQNAFRLRDAFGVDVADSISAVRTLTEQFGLSQQEAFDLVTSGFQRGLNRSGDLLDTINEYSVQFANAGASSAEFFGLLESGLAGGNLGTDKAADAFKEFFVRIQDGSDTTTEALQAIGLDAAGIFDGLSAGELSGADVFSTVTQALSAIEDPLLRNQAGVALLGTQFEDLGGSLGALDLIPDSFEDVSGAIDSVDARYQSFGQLWQGLSRQFVVALQPLGDELLSLANEAMPFVEQAFAWMTDNLPGIVSTAVSAVQTAVNFIKELFSGELTAGLADGLGAFQNVRDWIEENMPLIRQTIQTVLDAIQRFWDAHGETILGIVTRTFNTIQATIESILDIVLGVIRAVMLAINGDWEGAFQELQNVAQIYMDAVLRLVTTSISNLADIILAVGPALYNAGRSIIGNLWNGISSRFDSLISDTRAKWQQLVDFLPGSEPRDPTSPFRNLAARGEAIIDNVQSGIERGALNLSGVMAPQTRGGEPVIVYQTINGAEQMDAAQIRRASRDGILDAQRRRGM